MKIIVNLTRSNKTIEIDLKKDSTVEDLLAKLDIKPDTVVALKNKKPIPEDETLVDKENITLMQIASSG